MKRTQRILAYAALAVVALSTLAVGTAAYFVTEETSRSVITTGKVHLALVDENGDGAPWPEDGLMDVMPATEVARVVCLENRGNAAFFARVRVEVAIHPAAGEPLDVACICPAINTDHWAEQDGFYYYRRALAPGERTEPLFTRVRFAPEMGNAYMNAKAELHVLAQAVQCAHNGENPLEAVGWPEAAHTAEHDDP